MNKMSELLQLIFRKKAPKPSDVCSSVKEMPPCEVPPCQDVREWPCEHCDTGEYVHIWTHQETQCFACTDCGHEVRMP